MPTKRAEDSQPPLLSMTISACPMKKDVFFRKTALKIYANILTKARLFHKRLYLLYGQKPVKILVL